MTGFSFKPRDKATKSVALELPSRLHEELVAISKTINTTADAEDLNAMIVDCVSAAVKSCRAPGARKGQKRATGNVAEMKSRSSG